MSTGRVSMLRERREKWPPVTKVYRAYSNDDGGFKEEGWRYRNSDKSL